ncbi:MAG: class I SAM-dependent methyltransferase [Bacteroidota bacterium]|nr:class I SAM-dependent methyltransferase [Bacteroidota bacterium]
MKEYTPEVAKSYDKALFFAMFRIRKRMVKVAKELKAKRIFDLCCGTGNQLKYFKKAGFNDIVGVDLSENMISVANNSSNKLNCLLEDATNTSLKENSFDFGMVSFALHEKSLEIAKGMIIEANRLIKNGCYFVVVDYCFDKKSTSLGRWGSTFVEKLVGGNHYKNFKKYINAGGLNFLMKKYKFIKEYPFIFGSVKMRIYQF